MPLEDVSVFVIAVSCASCASVVRRIESKTVFHGVHILGERLVFILQIRAVYISQSPWRSLFRRGAWARSTSAEFCHLGNHGEPWETRRLECCSTVRLEKATPLLSCFSFMFPLATVFFELILVFGKVEKHHVYFLPVLASLLLCRGAEHHPGSWHDQRENCSPASEVSGAEQRSWLGLVRN